MKAGDSSIVTLQKMIVKTEAKGAYKKRIKWRYKVMMKIVTQERGGRDGNRSEGGGGMGFSPE